MKLYHGSTMSVYNPNISRSRANTDFGKGFHTTTSREQAEKWARIKKEREGDIARAIVSVYELNEAILQNPEYKTCRFNGATIEWLEFVVDNRRKNNPHDFDFVIGPVADDTIYMVISLYENGVISAEAAIERLKTHTLFDQLSFNTLRACKLLTFVESSEVK